MFLMSRQARRGPWALYYIIFILCCKVCFFFPIYNIISYRLADVEVHAAGAAVLHDEGGLGPVVEAEDAGADALVHETEQRL